VFPRRADSSGDFAAYRAFGYLDEYLAFAEVCGFLRDELESMLLHLSFSQAAFLCVPARRACICIGDNT